MVASRDQRDCGRLSACVDPCTAVGSPWKPDTHVGCGARGEWRGCALALLSGRLGFLDSGCSNIFLCDLGGAVLLNVSFLKYKQRGLSRGSRALAVGQVPSDPQAHSHLDPPAARGPTGGTAKW